MSKGLIPQEKKIFSIYIANETDRSYSSILFGGSDEGGFQKPEEATEFVVNNNADDYSVPLLSYQIGDKESVS